MKREDACAYNFSSTATDTHLFARSEHSQGGAERSEQYLYVAQRAVKSRVGSSRSEEKIKAQFSEDRTATNQQLLVAHRRGCAAGPHCSPQFFTKRSNCYEPTEIHTGKQQRNRLTPVAEK
jgi:hypothetical protein